MLCTQRIIEPPQEAGLAWRELQFHVAHLVVVGSSSERNDDCCGFEPHRFYRSVTRNGLPSVVLNRPAVSEVAVVDCGFGGWSVSTPRRSASARR